jgi:ubiquinone/menaquinone biosynthesis C-methylase UbiE
MDAEQFKERQRHVWGLGDYSVLSGQLAPAARELCDACAVSAGQEVLDVGAGDGNFALACAREGATVVASDLSPGMVERGRVRAEAEGFAIEWLEADAEELRFEDGRFDCVGSVFGAMIAPRPRRVAEELFRVARPGGTVGMTAWLPERFPAQMFAQVRHLLGVGPDLPDPDQWAVEATARKRFEGLAAHIELEPRRLVWEAESPEAMEQLMAESSPALIGARQALEPERWESLRRDNLEQIRRWNVADDGSLRLEAEYALIVARKRG